MKAEFYHTFHHDGKVIEGQWDLNPTMGVISSNIDVKGKKVLDAACRDGWYSYVFERMGAASVTGLDVEDRDARRIMHRVYGSKVAFRHENIYSLRKDDEDSYDVVFAGDVLCHLDNPILAARALCRVAREVVYVVTDVWPTTRVNAADYVWWMDKASWMALLKIAGFANVREKAAYNIHSEHWRKLGLLGDRTVVLLECVPGRPKSVKSVTEEVGWDCLDLDCTCKGGNIVTFPQLVHDIDIGKEAI